MADLGFEEERYDCRTEHPRLEDVVKTLHGFSED